MTGPIRLPTAAEVDQEMADMADTSALIPPALRGSGDRLPEVEDHPDEEPDERL